MRQINKIVAVLLIAIVSLSGSMVGANVRDSIEPNVERVIASASVAPVESIADKFGSDLFWISIGVSLDLYSTSASLRWCKVCAEGNPLGWDPEARLSLKIGMGVTGGVVCWKLRRGGHDKAATIVRWIIFGVQGAAASSNFYHAIWGK